MKKLESYLGFDINLDDEGNVVINDMCEYPQLSKNCQTFYNKLELIKIDESKITFPIQLKEWVVTISSTDKKTIMEYFKIDGIKKVVEENKSKLIDKVTFVKGEIYYPKKSKYPKLAVHFYQVVEKQGFLVENPNDLIYYFEIFYDNPKQFTPKRIAELEKFVNTQELFQIPFLPVELVRFDKDNNIAPFQNHELAKSASELPF
ncbi:hypothetical protein [Flavobacterium sp.]|jgi:hypothetical protein|uniref:hypothetical protein n=1 Tax=Flavobacterium sp. TaxID=239 RepID=UPI00262D7350|nr:hypothetical protein [Flavobacterium sp.]